MAFDDGRLDRASDTVLGDAPSDPPFNPLAWAAGPPDRSRAGTPPTTATSREPASPAITVYGAMVNAEDISAGASPARGEARTYATATSNGPNAPDAATPRRW